MSAGAAIILLGLQRHRQGCVSGSWPTPSTILWLQSLQKCSADWGRWLEQPRCRAPAQPCAPQRLTLTLLLLR